MTSPKRIQRKRTAGWRMPEGAVYVGRQSLYGNPWATDRRGKTAGPGCGKGAGQHGPVAARAGGASFPTVRCGQASRHPTGS